MKVGVIIANQRTGTHVLGQILTGTGRMKYVGEVFHPNGLSSDRSARFYGFLRKKCEEGGGQSVWFPQYRSRLFREFCMEVISESSKRLPIIDIKYIYLHSLNSISQNPMEPPELLKFFFD